MLAVLVLSAAWQPPMGNYSMSITTVGSACSSSSLRKVRSRDTQHEVYCQTLAGSCARAVAQITMGFPIFFGICAAAPVFFGARQKQPPHRQKSQPHHVIEVVFAVLGPTQHPSVQHWKKLA